MFSESKDGVSPVIGIILLTAVTVALVSLAAFFVFGIGQSSSSGVGTATVTANYESESRIDVQLLRQGSSNKIIVQSSLGTEYVLNETGDSVVLLNQDGNQTPVVLGEKDGERSVLRSVPPRSFRPDIVVSKQSGNGQYSTVQSALNNAEDGDIIVLQRGVYFENIDMSTSNVTLVGESGTVIADNTSDNAVVDVQAQGVRVSNIDLNASSSQGGSAAEYGIDTASSLTVSRVSIQNATTNETVGTVKTTSSSQFVSKTVVSGIADISSNAVPLSPVSNFVQKYNSSGYDVVFGVAVDSEDGIVAGGYHSSSGGRDWRVAKYNKSGDEQWVRTYDSGSDMDIIYDVAADSSGNVIAAGVTLSSGDSYNWRVARYYANGTEDWNRTYRSGSGDDRAYSVTVDENDDIVVAGFTDGSDNSDWRVVKYDRSGDKQWINTYRSGNGIDQARGVAVGKSNNIVVVGQKRSSSGSTNWRVARYYANGTEDWNQTYGSGIGGERAYSVDIGGSNDIVIGGSKSSSSDKKDWRLAKYNQTGSQQWVRSYGSGNGSDKVLTVDVGAENNILVGGFQQSGSDGTDWRFSRYDSTGVPDWNRTYSSSNGNELVRDVSIGGDFVVIVGEERISNTNWRIVQYGE